MDISISCISEDDLPDIARLANCHAIAAMTANLPHPYTEAHAKTWYEYLQTHDCEHVFKVCGKGKLMGVVGLVHEAEHDRAELGYWLGEKYWGKGHMSAAVAMAVAYAFEVLGVRRVYSRCFSVNIASQHVLANNGFELEGCLKQHHVRMGITHDVLCYGLVK